MGGLDIYASFEENASLQAQTPLVLLRSVLETLPPGIFLYLLQAALKFFTRGDLHRRN